MIGGGSLDQALELLTRGEADSAIVMENDLYRHAAKDKVDAALDNVANLIVVDHQRTAIMDKANLILSAASFAEATGRWSIRKAAHSASSRFMTPLIMTIRKSRKAAVSCWKAGVGCTPCTQPIPAAMWTGRNWIM